MGGAPEPTTLYITVGDTSRKKFSKVTSRRKTRLPTSRPRSLMDGAYHRLSGHPAAALITSSSLLNATAEPPATQPRIQWYTITRGCPGFYSRHRTTETSTECTSCFSSGRRTPRYVPCCRPEASTPHSSPVQCCSQHHWTGTQRQTKKYITTIKSSPDCRPTFDINKYYYVCFILRLSL